jgi:hypothetical protein
MICLRGFARGLPRLLLQTVGVRLRTGAFGGWTHWRLKGLDSSVKQPENCIILHKTSPNPRLESPTSLRCNHLSAAFGIDPTGIATASFVPEFSSFNLAPFKLPFLVVHPLPSKPGPQLPTKSLSPVTLWVEKFCAQGGQPSSRWCRQHGFESKPLNLHPRQPKFERITNLACDRWRVCPVALAQ